MGKLAGTERQKTEDHNTTGRARITVNSKLMYTEIITLKHDCVLEITILASNLCAIQYMEQRSRRSEYTQVTKDCIVMTRIAQ